MKSCMLCKRESVGAVCGDCVSKYGISAVGSMQMITEIVELGLSIYVGPEMVELYDEDVYIAGNQYPGDLVSLRDKAIEYSKNKSLLKEF